MPAASCRMQASATNSDPMPDDPIEVTHDAALGGRLRLAQPKRGHRFGHDAILLAAAVDAKPGERVIEFGAGVGAAGLALMSRVPRIDLTLIEIEPLLAKLAADNIAANGFSGRAHAIALDVAAPAQDFADAGLTPGCADQVLMNPPFNDRSHRASPDPLRRRAHAAQDETFASWIEGAARLLRPEGTLTVIGRADRLPAMLSDLSRDFGSIAVLPIHSIESEPAIRAICRAVKGGREPTVTLSGFVLNDRERKATAAAERVLRAGEALRLDQR